MSFTISDRLIYNAKDSREKTEQFIGKLQGLCGDPAFQKTFGEDVRQIVDRLKRQADGDLKIVVAGDFKRGKSTLINAILGEDIVPTDVSPETITVNHISYRETDAVEAVLQNGLRVSLKPDEIARENLEQVMKDLPAPIERLEIFRPLPVLKEVTLIDTPGLGETDEAFEKIVAETIAGADILIYLVSALSPLSASEQVFLNAAVYPQNFAKMFVVVNMADSLESEEDAERVKGRVEEMIYAAAPEATVFILSALDECCRNAGTARPNANMAGYLQEQYQSFADAIVNDVVAQKDMIKAERLSAMEQNAVRLIESKINGTLKLADMDSEKREQTEKDLRAKKKEIDTALAETRRTVNYFVEDRKKEAKVWIGEFLTRMKQALTEAQTTVKGQEAQKHLSFYISDKTKEAFVACLNVHAKQLDEMIREQMQNIQNLQLGGSAFGGSLVRLKDVSWTSVDLPAFLGTQIGARVDNLFGGSLFTTLIQAGFGFARQSKVAKNQKEVLTPVIDNFREISEQVFAQLNETYDEYAKKAMEAIENYYRASLDEALEAVNRAKQENEAFSTTKQELQSYLNGVLQSLQKIAESIA